MSTISTEPPPTQSAELAPLTRFRRVGGALSLLTSGTLVFASLVMIPYQNETAAQYLQTGVDHRTNILWAAVVLHFGYLLLVPAAFTLIRLARRRNPKTSIVATVLSGLGMGLSGIIVVDFYDVALANALPADEALRIFDLAGSYGQGALVAAPSVIGMALGINLAVYVAWRAGAIPVYPVVLNVVGGSSSRRSPATRGCRRSVPPWWRSGGDRPRLGRRDRAEDARPGVGPALIHIAPPAGPGSDPAAGPCCRVRDPSRGRLRGAPRPDHARRPAAPAESADAAIADVGGQR